uniref:KxDL domain-containing protein n=1 Tax=Strongyloides papillosus TaxID=174720 RepID=A0A0N5BER5_STREA
MIEVIQETVQENMERKIDSLVHSLRQRTDNTMARVKADFFDIYKLSEEHFEGFVNKTFEEFLRTDAFTDLFTVEGENIIFVRNLKRGYSTHVSFDLQRVKIQRSTVPPPTAPVPERRTPVPSESSEPVDDRILVEYHDSD